MAVPFATFDYHRFPRFIQVFLQGTPATPLDFHNYLQGLHHMYTHKEQFSLLMDASNMSGKIAPQYVVEQAMFMKESEENARKYLKKVAVITNSSLVQALIHNLFLIYKPVSETKLFTDKKQALRWLFNLDK